MVKTLRDYPDILNVADVMEILRIGRISVYKLIEEKKIPSRNIAGKYKIPKSGVIAFIREIENNLCYNDNREDSDAL